MPSIKEKCVCQICICGRHHCGEEIKFPTLIEEPEGEEAAGSDLNARPPGNERIIAFDTNRHKTVQGPSTSRAQVSEQTSSNGQKVYFKVEKKVTRTDAADQEPMSDLDESVSNETSNQRKQWQTSPNEVEQLTRSLSRLRTDLDTGLHYEKFVEKEQNSKTQHKSKSKAVTYEQPYLNTCDNSKYLASRMNQLKKDSAQDSFLPPLTGFSDSDSSFGSFSCFGDGECKNQMHCICETLKNCNLNTRNGVDKTDPSINYIDSDQWIVTKPQRMRPKDNLRLDGSMDLNTTFRSTYDETARKIAPSDSDESKRSSRASNSQQTLYLGTKQGRTGHTPVLRSARRRRARNRPQTSLKLGGNGCYHTINQDSYKNFVIVDGQAKTINNNANDKQFKLPKMVQKKRSLKLRGKGCEEERKLYRVGDEEIEKVEKKSLRIVNNDLSGESDVEKVKLIHVVKRPIKTSDHDEPQDEPQVNSKDAQTDSDDLPIKPVSNEPKPSENWTIDNASSSMRRQFASHRYQDHIKEMGLLERNETGPVEVSQERKHQRRLHETSTRIILPDTATPPPRAPPPAAPVQQAAQNRLISQPRKTVKSPPKAVEEKFVDGHVVDRNHPKPFLIPQRIHRHKNQSSVNLFNGEMDFATTSRQAYGGGRGRVGSGKRRVPTAGKRVLRSARRRNLFRQSSDSMFSCMDPVNFIKKRPVEPDSGRAKTPSRSVYNQEYGDHLYCPALDVSNAKTNDSFKFTGEAGGHKYYLSTQYDH